jgi:ABC-type Fe3+ transport system substrate-binding protein
MRQSSSRNRHLPDPVARPRRAGAIMSPAGMAFLACAACAVVGAACPGYAADAALYRAARHEGEVVWYTALIVTQAVRPLIAAFNRKYPGIEVHPARADSGPTAIKIINEARARKVQSDVFDGIDATPPLVQAGLVEPYIPSEAGKYPPELKDPDGHWNALVLYFLTPAINTDLVSRPDTPRTAQDLLDPKWKGRIAWSTAASSGAAVYIGSVLATMGEQRGMDFLRALSKQSIVNVDATNRAILDQVILGEYAISLNAFNHHAVLSARKGAPVAWLKLEPISGLMHSIGLTRNAPHPNAGRLLIDFLTSEDGQRTLAEVEYLPAMPFVLAKTPELKPEAGGFKANMLAPDTVTRNQERWVAVKKELFN